MDLRSTRALTKFQSLSPDDAIDFLFPLSCVQEGQTDRSVQHAAGILSAMIVR
jgi:hypothetical protein